MTKKTHFYYDESEHSRKINYSTITAENYYDNFVTVIVGWDKTDEKSIEKNILILKLNTRIENQRTNLKVKQSNKSN